MDERLYFSLEELVIGSALVLISRFSALFCIEDLEQTSLFHCYTSRSACFIKYVLGILYL